MTTKPGTQRVPGGLPDYFLNVHKRWYDGRDCIAHILEERYLHAGERVAQTLKMRGMS